MSERVGSVMRMSWTELEAKLSSPHFPATHIFPTNLSIALPLLEPQLLTPVHPAGVGPLIFDLGIFDKKFMTPDALAPAQQWGGCNAR